jgi:hypothetical protein
MGLLYSLGMAGKICYDFEVHYEFIRRLKDEN